MGLCRMQQTWVQLVKSQRVNSLVNELWCLDVIAYWPMSLFYGIWKSDQCSGCCIPPTWLVPCKKWAKHLKLFVKRFCLPWGISWLAGKQRNLGWKGPSSTRYSLWLSPCTSQRKAGSCSIETWEGFASLTLAFFVWISWRKLLVFSRNLQHFSCNCFCTTHCSVLTF